MDRRSRCREAAAAALWRRAVAARGAWALAMAVPTGTTFHDLKPRLAKSLVEAGKDVAVVTFGVDFISAPDHQHVALQGVVDAADDHGDTPRRCEPDAWLKAKTEDVVVKRDGNNDFYLKLKVRGETRTKVIVKDPPTVVWLKAPIFSKKTLFAQTAPKNPGCGFGQDSDIIYPAHLGGFFVANTRTTNHSSDGNDSYGETFTDRPDFVSVSITQSTGACEHQKTAKGQLQAIEMYPTTTGN